MKIIGLIPARYASTRYPGKPLVKLLNKPMIIWVCEKTAEALGKDNVWVATEDKRIYDIVIKNDFNAVMTDDKALTGTDRLYQASKQIDADIYINIQGDEPLLNVNDICKVRDEKIKNFDEVINCMAKLSAFDEPLNKNIPKAITNEKNKLIYMSRLPIPGYKDARKKPSFYWKQVCIYAFNHKELMLFGEYGKKSFLEEFEDIEILRFFDLDIPIRMIEVSPDTYAVDVEEDVTIVEKEMIKRGYTY